MKAIVKSIIRRTASAGFVFPPALAAKRLANIARNEWEYRSGKRTLTSLPYVLFIDVACACTLKCPLCFIGQGAPGRPRGLMESETFRKVIDEFRDYAVVAHLYIRGEPLMNRRLPEMIAYADDAHMLTSISTNLNRLDEETAERIVASGLKKLTVSLDGATAETYRTYRVGGDFEQVLENIRLLQRIKEREGVAHPRIILQFLVFKFNIHEVPAIRRLAESLGVELSLLQGILGGPEYEPFTGEHTQALVDRWIVRPEKLLEALGEDRDGAGLFFDYFRGSEPLSDSRCLFLWKTAYINWDGSVSPCCFIYRKELDFGSIADGSFRGIWNNPEFRHARALFTDASQARSKTRTVCDSCRHYRQASEG